MSIMQGFYALAVAEIRSAVQRRPAVLPKAIQNLISPQFRRKFVEEFSRNRNPIRNVLLDS